MNLNFYKIFFIKMSIHESWNKLFEEYYFNLDSIYQPNVSVFPKNKNDVFKVFEMDVNKIRVVLLGQDCYHANEFQANGLAFSVQKDVTIPPSLRNIFKELQNEFPERNYSFNHGDLTSWAENEKIFLLNCSLTVEKSKPGSHMNIWKDFTDGVIKYIDEHNKNCVFILLGKFSESKKSLITNKENILIAPHPSPFSARTGFFDSNIFKKTEEILKYEINWQN